MSTKIRNNPIKLLYLHQNLGLFMKKTTFCPRQRTERILLRPCETYIFFRPFSSF
jgi:hypothetical protein